MPAPVFTSRSTDGHFSGDAVSNIYEVARRAGVSTATVSRVLSRPDVVSAATRRKVMQAVQDMGYTPNSAAKTLRMGRSEKILVTVPDISNPFFSLILKGIQDAAQRDGYAVLLGDTQYDEAREEGYARMLQRKEADGLVFLGHRLPAAAAELARVMAPRCAPIVHGCEYSPTLGVPSVHIDNATAAADALDHLYSLGHRRVGIITGPLMSPLSRDRLQGATDRAQAHGAAEGLMVARGDFTVESGAAAAEALLDWSAPPTALFCFNDMMAIGAIASARQRGLHVPRDLSVIGFDDIRVAAFMDPPLTTVAQPMREIGEGAVRLLLEILRGDGIEPVSVTLPHHLTIRASTAPAPRSAAL